MSALILIFGCTVSAEAGDMDERHETLKTKGDAMAELFDYQDQWESLASRAADRYDTLAAGEKVWYNVQVLIQSIENGGLVSYYYNSYAERLDDCMASLDALDARKMKKLMLHMNALFPGGVPKDITKRNDIINSWPEDDEDFDEKMDALEDEALEEAGHLEVLLVEYIEQKGLVK